MDTFTIFLYNLFVINKKKKNNLPSSIITYNFAYIINTMLHIAVLRQGRDCGFVERWLGALDALYMVTRKWRSSEKKNWQKKKKRKKYPRGTRDVNLSAKTSERIVVAYYDDQCSSSRLLFLVIIFFSCLLRLLLCINSASIASAKVHGTIAKAGVN